jgi:hypothetical protein
MDEGEWMDIGLPVVSRGRRYATTVRIDHPQREGSVLASSVTDPSIDWPPAGVQRWFDVATQYSLLGAQSMTLN